MQQQKVAMNNNLISKWEMYLSVENINLKFNILNYLLYFIYPNWQNIAVDY